MARTRQLKPSFFTNEQLADCSPLARLVFAGLWCLADRAGKVRDQPRRIKAELCPFESEPDAGGWLEELSRSGLIIRYEVDGQRLIKIPNFLKHQHPHPKEPPSELPEPCKATAEQDLSAASRVKDMSSRAGSSGSSGSSVPAATAAVALHGRDEPASPLDAFRVALASRMAVPSDWLRVAKAERVAQVREQLTAEVSRLGLARAVDVAAEAATRTSPKPRWLAWFVGALQDAPLRPPSSEPYREPWAESPRSEIWRDEKGRTLAEIRSLPAEEQERIERENVEKARAAP